jgi:hypothetical protein
VRLLIDEVEMLPDVAVVYGAELDARRTRRAAVISHRVVPLVLAPLTLAGAVACDVDDCAVITEDPFT